MLVVVFLILAALLRAVVLPLLLIGTVILSFAAALGVSTAVFSGIFGYPGEQATLPLLAFIFLVALGVDYNIFLASRVREEAGRHGTREGMIRGLAVTGGVITSAGIVLAGTFTMLATLPLKTLTEVGFTIAFGVLLDTFIVRSVLVPALVLDAGDRVWWPGAVRPAGRRRRSSDGERADQKRRLIGDRPLERLAEVDLEVADGVAPHLTAWRAGDEFQRRAAGATESPSQMQNSAGQRNRAAASPGPVARHPEHDPGRHPVLPRGLPRDERAEARLGIECRHHRQGARVARPRAGSAVAGREPRRPRRPRASAVARSAVTGGRRVTDASPSVNGHWATIAATRGSAAPTAITWPPENELPKSATRSGSTQSSPRAYAIAA